MFTGLVQQVGKVVSRTATCLQIEASAPPDDPWVIGESIAINGCCLTLVPHREGEVLPSQALESGESSPSHLAPRTSHSIDNRNPKPETLNFDISEETCRRTNLGDLVPGDLVNVERAMRAGDRFGGHIVQGHVDTTGTVATIDGSTFRFQVDPGQDRYLIDKGSITIDGISLTVVTPEQGKIEAWIIPHTLEHTNLQDKKPGDRVNIEFDVIAKHVEKLLRPGIV